MQKTVPINIINRANQPILKKPPIEEDDEEGYSIINNCNLSASPPHVDFLQSHIKSMYPTARQTWTKDNLMNQCIICSVNFTSFNRKHHCRACGGIICQKCSTNRIIIPEEIIKKPDIPNDIYTKISLSITSIINKDSNSNTNKKERICDICYVKIEHLLDAKINIMIAEYLDFYDLHVIYNVSKKWRNASIHMLSKFRTIQYQNIDYKYNKWEFNILSKIQLSLMNHTNWLMSLIKCMIQNHYDNLTNNNVLSKLIEDLKSKEQHNKISCTKLMCNLKCKIPLDVSDICDILKYIAILNLKNNIFWNSNELQILVLTIIDFIPNHFLEHHHIIVFSLIMRLLLSTINNINERNIPFINNFFLKLTNNDIKTLILLGFEINYINKIQTTYQVEQSTSFFSAFFSKPKIEDTKEVTGIKNFNKVMNDYLTTNLDSKSRDILSRTINTLTNIQKKPILPIYYPFDPTYMITKINKITEYTSASKPLLIDAVIETTPSMIEKRRSSMQESTPPSLSSIPLYLEKSKNIKFIIKNDLNVRKEHVVASLIEILHYKLIEQSIKKRLDSFDRIPTYKIIMIDKTIGIIEYVENSNTLGSLRTKNISILNHVLEHNNMLTVDVIRSRYAKSLAIWSCISYILGFGDRHLDNIMINKDGLIFHIDYGYITDNPMTNIFSAPIIRITFEMIECLGGENSTYYNLFKNYVADVFNLIRLYTNIIINNYYILGYEKIVDWTDFKNKIIDRFMVGMSGKEVIISLDNEIKNSYNSFSSFSVDLFHSIGSLKTYLTFGLSP